MKACKLLVLRNHVDGRPITQEQTTHGNSFLFHYSTFEL